MRAPVTRGPGAALEAAMSVAPILGVATSIVLAQMLGPEGRGQMSTLTVWAKGAALVCFFSLDKGLVDAANRMPGEGRGVAVSRAHAAGRTLAWALSAVAAVAALVILLGLGTGALLSVAGASAALCTCRAEWRAGVLIATRHWRRYNSWRIVQPVVYTAGLLSLWALAPHLDNDVVIAAAAAIFAGSTLVGWLWLRSGTRQEHLAEGPAPVRPLLAFSARYHVTTMATFAATRADLLVAPIVMPFAAVGVYAVAVAPGSLIAAVASASLLRALTGHSSARASWLPTAAVAAVALVGVLLAPIVLPIAFGHEFVHAVLPAQILLVAAAFYYVGQGITGRLAHAGRPATAAIPAIVCVAVVVCGALVLRTPTGLAIAVLVGRAASLVCGLLLARSISSQQQDGSPPNTSGADPIP
jgi:O-antigen/teichoic acid export membrane protein